MQTISTQYESPDFNSTSRRTKSWTTNREYVLQQPLFYDFLDIESAVDLEKLKAWSQCNWFSTIRKALLHRNIMQYHACCNSFSRRNFCRTANHPADQTFQLHRVPAFRSIETGEDLFRWLVTTAKENTKNGRRTLFPTVNIRHVEVETQENRSEDIESTGSLRKRCLDLEKDLEDHRRTVRDLQSENLRLLCSSKMWHSKYEELLDQKEPSLDIYATPIKKKLSNEFMFQTS